MKTKITLLTFMLVFFGVSNSLNAQTLFKDLNLGAGHADPVQFANVNGTMYFITFSRSSGYTYQLWKSDGTAANTVMLKDNVLTAAIGDGVMFRGNIGNTVYYSVNAYGATAGTTTDLWETDGSAPVLVTSLSHPGLKNYGGGHPLGFTVVGSKLFFNMWKDNGRELWVSDGTAAGTFEVIDLQPGDNGGGVQLSGVAANPMVAFNGKVYFQGGAKLGSFEFYSSDGTATGTTLVKEGVYNPENFIVYKNELYFSAGYSNDELWKTDGTADGTVKIATCNFDKAYIFNNQLFFTSSNNLWKSDGTTTGTVLVKSAVGQITGANNDYLFTTYMKMITVSPYFEMQYWKSDGTTDGTVQVSENLGMHASFDVLNNKMYTGLKISGRSIVSGFWETDGTEAETKEFIPASSPGQPFVFNNTVFFSNGDLTNGIELWSYTPGVVEGINDEFTSKNKVRVFPNPASGRIKIEWSGNQDASLHVFNFLGQEVIKRQISKEIDFSNQPKGIYILKIQEGAKNYTKKIVIQ